MKKNYKIIDKKNCRFLIIVIFESELKKNFEKLIKNVKNGIKVMCYKSWLSVFLIRRGK